MTPRAAAIAVLLIVAVAAGAAPRSRVVLRDFQREHPCPATGERRGKCPGYQIDHVQALCAGGPDIVANLQWLSLPDHAAKTRKDDAACAGRAYR